MKHWTLENFEHYLIFYLTLEVLKEPTLKMHRSFFLGRWHEPHYNLCLWLSKTLTKQNLSHTIPVSSPCFLCVECVALSSFLGSGCSSMCDMISASFKLLNLASYIPRVALVNIGERGNFVPARPPS